MSTAGRGGRECFGDRMKGSVSRMKIEGRRELPWNYREEVLVGKEGFVLGKQGGSNSGKGVGEGEILHQEGGGRECF